MQLCNGIISLKYELGRWKETYLVTWQKELIPGSFSQEVSTIFFRTENIVASNKITKQNILIMWFICLIYFYDTKYLTFLVTVFTWHHFYLYELGISILIRIWSILISILIWYLYTHLYIYILIWWL